MIELQRVLAATDGSEHGLCAVVTGAGCAGRTGANLQLISVVDTILLPMSAEGAEYHTVVEAELRARVEAHAEEADATAAPIHIRKGHAAPVITETAEELEADLIVVGAHPRPAVARFLVGSTAERVIRLSHSPVLVATEKRREPFRRILATVDLSRQSRRVLETAAAIAQADQAAIKTLYVQDRLTPMLMEAAVFDVREHRDHARNQFEQALSEVSLPSELMMSAEIREGHAGHEVLHEAQDWDADLIVMGTHGFGFFNRLLLGSTSIHVWRHGHRETLVVPRAEEE